MIISLLLINYFSRQLIMINLKIMALLLPLLLKKNTTMNSLWIVPVLLRWLSYGGLYLGLNMAWQSGIHWLRVEVDSLCVYQMVAKSCRLNNKFSPLIWSIKEFLKRDWHIRINHIYRVANYVADHMPNLTISFSLGLYMFMISPKVLSPYFFMICMG